jgi:tripartite-type tricarboxylate transporter receptor subunit TctC
VFAPANTPAEIVTRLNTEMRLIIDNPEVKGTDRRHRVRGLLQQAGGARRVRQGQLVHWGKMVKDAGIQPE